MSGGAATSLDSYFVPAAFELESNRRYLDHLRIAEADPSTIRLMSNESSYPPAPGVADAVARAVGSANLYPPTDPALRRLLAQQHHVDPDNVLIGAGASELIDATIRAFAGPDDEVVVPVPTWPVYAKRLIATGARMIQVPLRLSGSAYRHDVNDIVSALTGDTKLVILCSPNNPTGNMVRRSQLLDVAGAGLPVLVDGAYDDFADEGDRVDGEAAGRLVRDHPNVVVARTFSKSYALAGARLGYLLGQGTVLERIERFLLPGSCVSSLALAAGTAALADRRYMADHVAGVIEERGRLTLALRAAGWTVFDSSANFICVDTSRFGGGAGRLCAGLLDRRIAVRAMSDALVRITVGKREDNDALIAAVRDLRVPEVEGAR